MAGDTLMFRELAINAKFKVTLLTRRIVRFRPNHECILAVCGGTGNYFFSIFIVNLGHSFESLLT